MDYARIYAELIGRGKTRDVIVGTYYERHHIIPKCLGGTNDKNNLVKLTAREHYLVHWLLTKIHPTDFKIWTAFALMSGRLCPFGTRVFTSSAFERCRKAQSIATSIRILGGWRPGASEKSRAKARDRMNNTNPIALNPSLNWTARLVTVYFQNGTSQNFTCGSIAAKALNIPYATWKWMLRYNGGKSDKHGITHIEQSEPKPTNKKFQ